MEVEAVICPTCRQQQQKPSVPVPVQIQKADIGGFMKSEAFDFREYFIHSYNLWRMSVYSNVFMYG